jgi:tight adherence protein B
VTALLLLGVSMVLVRAPSPAVVRWRGLRAAPAVRRTVRPALPRLGPGLAAVVGAGLVGGWARVGYGAAVPVLPAVAGAVAGATAAVVVGRLVADRARRRNAGALVESVGALAADLRAGQPSAAVAGSPVARHRSVAAVWAVSETSGASAAAVLDRVEEDLRIRRDQQREVDAQLAGARSTAALLAVLPGLGIGLGVAMGARPLAVLLGEPRGQVALVAGVLLDAVGVLWTNRIIAAAGGPR